MPRRVLILLSLVVLALHLWLLQGLPHAAPGHAPAAGPVFATRTVEPPPPPPAPVAAPAPRPAEPARPRPPVRKPPPPRPEPPPDEAPAQAPTPPRMQAATPDMPVDPADPETDPATEPVAEAAAPAAAASAPLAAASDAVPATDATAVAQAPAASVPAAPASPPLPATPPASAASAPAAPPVLAAVDIVPPGGQAGGTADTAPPPVRIPPPVRLNFNVEGEAKRFTYHARAELLWQHDGQRYEARQEISALLLGSRAQRSVGSITAQGLQPQRFSDRSRSEVAAHFDYTAGRVTFSANTPSVPIGPGVQDRISVFLQLGAMMAAAPQRFVPGTQVTLGTVGPRNADRWTFTVENEETLDLPAGQMAAWKLQRLPRRDYDQKAELWLAPTLGYLPVRIRITQANGDFADLKLRDQGPP